MEAIEEGSADFAVLPIENSTAGAVDEMYDLLVEFENYIVGETVIPIQNTLSALPGTKFDENGTIVTNGGRVLGITATGKDLKEARAKAYEATEWVDFANKYMRHDIGRAIDEVK